MKTDLFQSCGHCWVVQICWLIECNNLTVSCFRIWNSSTGIPSPPLALFVAMLPKAHLTSHYGMSGSKWVTTPLWLFGSLRHFLYNSCVYSCHLFLISSASAKFFWFLSFIVPISAWNVPLVSLKGEQTLTISYSGGSLVAKSYLILATLWCIAHQASLSRRLPRQKYWSKLPFSSPGDLPNPGIELVSPGRFFYCWATREAQYYL